MKFNRHEAAVHLQTRRSILWWTFPPSGSLRHVICSTHTALDLAQSMAWLYQFWLKTPFEGCYHAADAMRLRIGVQRRVRWADVRALTFSQSNHNVSAHA